jgi:hypothetical protein
MEQLEIFGNIKNESEMVKIYDGQYIYVPAFLIKLKVTFI